MTEVAIREIVELLKTRNSLPRERILPSSLTENVPKCLGGHPIDFLRNCFKGIKDPLTGFSSALRAGVVGCHSIPKKRQRSTKARLTQFPESSFDMMCHYRRQDAAKLAMLSELTDDAVACQELIHDVSIFFVEDIRHLRRDPGDEVIEPFPWGAANVPADRVTKPGVWVSRRLNPQALADDVIQPSFIEFFGRTFEEQVNPVDEFLAQSRRSVVVD